MLQARLRKVGGSVMLAVPPALLEVLHLQAGSTVELEVEVGRLVVKPRERLRFGLDDLLAECDPTAPQPEPDDPWVAAGPQGAELI